LKSETRPRKLLAINFGGLGDEVLFLPTLQTIKKHHPSWSISLLTEPRARGIKQLSDLVDDNPTFDIKKRPLLPADYWDLVSLLRSGHYDVVVSSGSSPQVAGLLFLSGIPQRIGFGSNKLAKLLLTTCVPLNRGQHAAFMYHDLVQGLGLSGECERPQVKVNAAAIQSMRTLIGAGGGGSAQRRLILVHPGTSLLAIQKGIYKNWSPDNWATLIVNLIQQAQCAVVLAGGPDDAQTVSEIMAALERTVSGITSNRELFFNAHGKTANIDELVALIELSKLMICVDSAPMHIGVALNKPMVALFGPTDPAKLLWPDPRFIALRDEEAARRWGNADPFTQRPEHSPTWPLQPVPYVQIPQDTVFRTAMDQLKRVSIPNS
jgi:ADP-heptose:LPS heptosyltransferase